MTRSTPPWNPAEFLIYPALGALTIALYLGAYSVGRHHPRIAISLIALVIALAELRSRRKRAKAETLVASLACPTCGAQFGRDAAHAADPSLDRGLSILRIPYDRGFSTITCPSCGVRSYFHRRTHELTLTSPYPQFA